MWRQQPDELLGDLHLVVRVGGGEAVPAVAVPTSEIGAGVCKPLAKMLPRIELLTLLASTRRQALHLQKKLQTSKYRRGLPRDSRRDSMCYSSRDRPCCP